MENLKRIPLKRIKNIFFADDWKAQKEYTTSNS